MISGIPVSENTGLYVALSPEAQSHLRKKSDSIQVLWMKIQQAYPFRIFQVNK